MHDPNPWGLMEPKGQPSCLSSSSRCTMQPMFWTCHRCVTDTDIHATGRDGTAARRTWKSRRAGMRIIGPGFGSTPPLNNRIRSRFAAKCQQYHSSNSHQKPYRQQTNAAKHTEHMTGGPNTLVISQIDCSVVCNIQTNARKSGSLVWKPVVTPRRARRHRLQLQTRNPAECWVCTVLLRSRTIMATIAKVDVLLAVPDPPT